MNRAVGVPKQNRKLWGIASPGVYARFVLESNRYWNSKVDSEIL